MSRIRRLLLVLALLLVILDGMAVFYLMHRPGLETQLQSTLDRRFGKGACLLSLRSLPDQRWNCSLVVHRGSLAEVKDFVTRSLLLDTARGDELVLLADPQGAPRPWPWGQWLQVVLGLSASLWVSFLLGEQARWRVLQWKNRPAPPVAPSRPCTLTPLAQQLQLHRGLKIELGASGAALINPRKGEPLHHHLKILRREMAHQRGLPLPYVETALGEVPASSWRLLDRGQTLAQWSLPEGCAQQKCEAIRRTLGQFLNSQPERLLSLEEVARLLALTARVAPALVSLLGSRLDSLQITQTLQRYAQLGGSLVDLQAVLTRLALLTNDCLNPDRLAQQLLEV